MSFSSFFTDAGAFQNALGGNFTYTYWDFEADHLNPGDNAALDDFLNIDTHSIIASGIWSASKDIPSAPDLWPDEFHNVTFSSNTNPGGTFQPNAPGNNGMLYTDWQAGDIFEGNSLTAMEAMHSFDLLIGQPGRATFPAMWVDLISFEEDPQFKVTVYDENDREQGTLTVLGLEGQVSFLGMVMTDGATLGRMDIWDQNGGVEGISGIGAYSGIPAPGSLVLLGLASLVFTPRRRRA